MPYKQFLETYPLYRKFQTKVPSTLSEVQSPAINGICAICDSLQTFRQANKWHELTEHNAPSGGKVVRAEYICHSCTRFRWTFYLRFGDDRSTWWSSLPRDQCDESSPLWINFEHRTRLQ